MPQALTVSGLAAVRLSTKEAYRSCVSMLAADRPDAYIATAGEETVILRKKDLEWLTDKLETQHIDHEIVAVQSIADLLPEEAAQIRRKRGHPARSDLADRQKVLQDLRQRVRSP